MSLKTLLAVGESFSKPESKPYKKKDVQIPIFATTDEVVVGDRKKESQDLLTSIPPALLEGAPQMDFERAETAPAKEEPARKVRVAPERRRIEQEPPERRQFLKRWSRPTIRTISQAEMELEQVRVVRNDLSDSDLELAPRRAARGPQKDFNPFAPRPIAAIGRPTHEKLGMGERVARWFRFLKKPKS
jgi:hypothetical protein